MGAHDSPDMYALSPQACSHEASCIHIRQILRAHVTTVTCDMCYYYLDSNSNLISAQVCTLRLVYAKDYHASPDSIKSSYIMNKIYAKNFNLKREVGGSQSKARIQVV